MNTVAHESEEAAIDIGGRPDPRRTWPQRLTVAALVLAALASFTVAAGLAFGYWVISDRRLVAIDAPAADIAPGAGQPVVVVGGRTTTGAEDDATPQGVDGDATLAEPGAANFLVVGADNNDCGVDGTEVDDRSGLGERSDTIMIWRANPSADQLAVLSLPRDLYVDVAGGRKSRINSTYERNDPRRLIETIDRNFGIPVDHYVQVDFCAFQRLVDAVGGVSVPFDAPTRDRASGLLVPEAGCVELRGEQALAYVRSRKYQFEDPPGSGNWVTDGTSDFGRIGRQQDFLRRLVTKVIDEGLYSPRIATAIIETNRDYLVVDTGLTLRRMLEFANTLRRLDPAEIATFRVESSSATIDTGQEIEWPRLGSDNMQAILAVFRGEATIASAPEQVFQTDPTTPVDDTNDGTNDGTIDEPVEVQVEDNTVGVVPDIDIICT
ncbi:MAG: LCP family protein [Ilumatobacteraceae bacterium]